jgi:hypothetical protein
MNGQRDGDERMGQGPTLGRGTLTAYLGTAVALAASRVALYVWLAHRMHSHATTQTDLYFYWGLFPEGLLGTYTSLGLIDLGYSGNYLLWGSVFTLGSFIIATPVLLVGWLIRRRR